MNKDVCSKCGEALPNSDADLPTCPTCGGKASVEPHPGSENETIATTRHSNAGETTSPEGHFGEYELLEEIARGGMGVVFKARHKKLNRISALKMIVGGRFSSNEEVQRFQVEAEAAARLDHPGIVPIYEIGEHDDQPFFAMKFVECGSLADRMDDVRTDPDLAVQMLAKVARAVHHGHQRGILHRDLKPANILIDAEGEPLVADLGLAKSTTGESDLTHSGAILGTPSYMPPNKPPVTQRSQLRQNRQLVYLFVTILAGTTAVLTLLTAVLSGISSAADVYEYFPDLERPQLLSWATGLAGGAGIGSFLLLLILGLVSAIAARPPSFQASIKVGTFTGLVCILLLWILVGWLWFVGITDQTACR